MTAGPFHRVLVGWDCSAGAATALRAAAAIADSDAAHVVVLAVLHPVPRADTGQERPADMAGQRRQAEESFGRARDMLPAASRARVTLKFAQSSDAARAV
jgi:nucleotide-binding universal stress UspA family protein